MKKLFLLPILFSLLFAGCQQPDDEVDFPEPQKPVAERIIGVWINYADIFIDRDGKETTVPRDYLVYYIKDNGIYIYSNPEGHDQDGGAYTLSETGGKHYIEWNSNNMGHVKYEITTLTDSTLTLEMTDSLAQLLEGYPGKYYHNVMKFRRRIKHPLEDKVKSTWRTDTTTKVIYDTAGNIIKQEQVPNETYTYDINTDHLYINWKDEAKEETYAEYSLKDRDGKTYLELEYEDPSTTASYQIISVSDDKMVWEQKVSPTVSYIIEFTKYK